MKILDLTTVVTARLQRAGAQICGRIFCCTLVALAVTGCVTKAPKTNYLLLNSEKVLPQKLKVSRSYAPSDSLAQAHLPVKKVPGMTTSMVENRGVVYAQVYGNAEMEMSVPNSPATVNNIESVTEQFTAAIILRLAEAGKLSLDDPVTRYLPEYIAQDHPVTIRYLLHHTPDVNNHSANLLGVIIGRVTGILYADYVERELLYPLRLSQLEHTNNQGEIASAKRILSN